MAQTGYTPIYLYYSGTATHIPLAANLGNGELAINTADGNLFYKNTSNAVVTVPVLQSSATQSGWLSSTDWTTFNSKQPAGSYLTSVTVDSPLTGAGTSASHLSMPAATGSINGYLTSTDWTTFNNKQPAGTYVTSVSGTAPVVSSGGTTPAISMAAATGSVNGYLTSTDWTTFNGKQAALVSGTNIKTVNGTTLLGSGDVGTINVAHGGTGVSSASITAFNNITGYTASGATGTTSTNLVFSGAPTFTGVAAFAQIRSTYDGSSGSPSLDLRNSNGAQWEWYSPTSDNSLKLDVWVPGQRDSVLSIQNVAGSHNVTVSSGNLVIGTSGKGIDFSATPDATATSELLADYEEGTWTPTDGSGAGLTFAAGTTGNYTKIGRMVYITASVRYPVTANANYANIGGLPYTTSALVDGAQAGMNTDYSTATVVCVFKPANGATNMDVRALSGGAQQTNASMSNTRYDFIGFYNI